MRHSLSHLAQRWLNLHEEIKIHSAQLKALAGAAAPALLKLAGVGFDTVAEMLVTAGDNSDRIRSEAAFAKLCGACPIPAGSGKTSGRHRLNRGGNRQANAALFRIVIVRMRWHPPTIAYVERRKAEGLSIKDVIRCLKRFLAHEIYQLLPKPAMLAET
jgi:transposase